MRYTIKFAQLIIMGYRINKKSEETVFLYL